METRRDNVNNNRLFYGVNDFDLIGYSSYILDNAVNQENVN